jgi:hypothetical protein
MLKKHFKLIASMAIVGVALLCLPVLGTRAIQFLDIPANAPYLKAVEEVVGWGVMGGKSEGAFKPDEYVTRSELATALSQYNTFAKTEFVPMAGSFPKAEKPQLPPDGKVLDLNYTISCKLLSRQYCDKGQCDSEKIENGLLINLKNKMIIKCSKKDCARTLVSKDLKGNILTLKRKDGLSAGWDIVLDIPNGTFTEDDPRIVGGYVTTGTCENAGY